MSGLKPIGAISSANREVGRNCFHPMSLFVHESCLHPLRTSVSWMDESIFQKQWVSWMKAIFVPLFWIIGGLSIEGSENVIILSNRGSGDRRCNPQRESSRGCSETREWETCLNGGEQSWLEQMLTDPVSRKLVSELQHHRILIDHKGMSACLFTDH
jgi:hypothetical protein